MGYRLAIRRADNTGIADFYGTKLYGYLDNQEEFMLSSAKYLKSLGLIEDYQYFGYGAENPIRLNHDQFVEFMTRYSTDLTAFGDDLYKHCNLIDDTVIQELMDSIVDKIISWG